MSGERTSKEFTRRRSYVIDRPFQLSIVFAAVGVLATVAVSFLAMAVILPDNAFLARATADELQNMIVRMNAVYFLASSLAVSFLAVLITHRVAGPTYVLKNAIRGIVSGDYSRRLTLRKRDYLQDLSRELVVLRDSLVESHEERIEMVKSIGAKLESGDLDAVRQLLSKFSSSGVAPKEAPQITVDATASDNVPEESVKA